MDLSVCEITKRFKSRTILEDISFDVGPRELVSIVGPSGGGKTPLLKIIAQLDRPDAGVVNFSPPPTKKHPVIIVFQDYVLFPAMTVRSNIGFGLRARKMEKQQIGFQVDRMLDYFQLADMGEHYPSQLSAGQKQRVAIARGLMNQPDVLLMDEPTGNLDRKSGEDLMGILNEIRSRRTLSVVMVTHNEALARRAGRVGTLRDGCIEMEDHP